MLVEPDAVSLQDWFAGLHGFGRYNSTAFPKEREKLGGTPPAPLDTGL